jgi:hypothetical protein
MAFINALYNLWPNGDEKIPGLRDGMAASAQAVFVKYGVTTPLLIAHVMAWRHAANVYCQQLQLFYKREICDGACRCVCDRSWDRRGRHPDYTAFYRRSVQISWQFG